jgi:hypothetical protein
MHQVYEPLPATTLAIKLLELSYPLSNADWVPLDSPNMSVPGRPSRHQATEGDRSDEEARRITDDNRLNSPNHFEEAFDSVSHESLVFRREKPGQFRKGLNWPEKSIRTDFMDPFELSLAQTFSCVLLSDSGVFNISPSHMDDVMAISSGDSLFIAAPLLSDPAKTSSRVHKIRHVMGNIGRAGTALLQAPYNPKIRKIGVEQWTYISGEDWDGQRRDAFQDTSLHLWFTGSNLTLDGKHTALGEKDTELYMLESVVSVHGRGTSGCGEVSRRTTNKIRDIC